MHLLNQSLTAPRTSGPISLAGLLQTTILSEIDYFAERHYIARALLQDYDIPFVNSYFCQLDVFNTLQPSFRQLF